MHCSSKPVKYKEEVIETDMQTVMSEVLEITWALGVEVDRSCSTELFNLWESDAIARVDISEIN